MDFLFNHLQFISYPIEKHASNKVQKLDLNEYELGHQGSKGIFKSLFDSKIESMVVANNNHIKKYWESVFGVF